MIGSISDATTCRQYEVFGADIGGAIGIEINDVGTCGERHTAGARNDVLQRDGAATGVEQHIAIVGLHLRTRGLGDGTTSDQFDGLECRVGRDVGVLQDAARCVDAGVARRVQHGAAQGDVAPRITCAVGA